MMPITFKWAAATSMLITICSVLNMNGCAEKPASIAKNGVTLPVVEVQTPKPPVYDARLKQPVPRPTTQPAPADPTKNTATVQTAEDTEANTARAEQAAAAAQQAKAKASSAATAAEQAASKAEQAAASGDSQQASAAAADATASAAAAKDAAATAQAHSNQAQQYAKSSAAAATAADKADSAARVAIGHSLIAAQQAQKAQHAVEMAGKIAIATAGASQIGGAAKRASTQSKVANARFQDAQKAATSGNVKAAGAQADKAHEAANQAAAEAQQAQQRLGEIKKTVESITSDKASSENVHNTAQNALNDAQLSANAAQAAALAATKSAQSAKQLLQQAPAKIKQPVVQPKPATKPTPKPTSRPSPKATPKPLTRPAVTGVPRPKGGDIDMTKLPKLPVLPPRKTTPKGIITPNAPKATPARIKGRWLQTSANKGADFLPGGYRTNRLIFRADGILEVQRTFDKAGNISVTWRIGYKWNKDNSMITIGTDEADRPLESSLKGFEIEDSDVKATDATDTLPVILKCTRLKNGQIRLNGRLYKSSAE